jgi:glucose-6-phosphate isomerase
MNKELRIEYHIPEALTEESEGQLTSAQEAYNTLINKDVDMTGWIDYPSRMSVELLSQIEIMAETIKEKYSAVVLIGIGGSYMGSHAGLDFVASRNSSKHPKIFFGGINFSVDYHEKIMRELAEEDVALLIISKSGETAEIKEAYKLFKEYMTARYGKIAAEDRIYVITDPTDGYLHKLADEYGYPSLDIPKDIGGRFSFLTPVGLLPMAISGYSIREIIRGAVSATSDSMINKAQRLAAVRNATEGSGYTVELFACFDPCLTSLIQWIKQLYGESEGKDGRGMLPVNLEYSKDLHSLGQFIQEGRQIFTETILSIENDSANSCVKSTDDGYNSFDTIAELNDIAMRSVIAAHSSSGIPIIQIEIPERNEYSLGQSIYFFEMSCAIRGMMMGVNPFDQLGVENYKREMKKLKDL